MAFSSDEYTVFVLGAGASSHYGYPLGEDLIENIISSIRIKKDDIGYGRKTESVKIGDHSVGQNYKELRKRLEYFSPPSIDAFLRYESLVKNSDDPNKKLDIISAGKHLIAYQILLCENPSLCIGRFPKDLIKGRTYSNWYRYLYNSIISDTEPENFLKNNINFSIITFNYDVSLEHYLFSRLSASKLFEKEDLQTFFSEKLSKKIIHIYGQVDRYEWQGGKRNNSEYGCMRKDEKSIWQHNLYFTADAVKNNIFVIGDERNNKDLRQTHEQAKTELERAKNIFFLGFGFADENIDVLALQNLTRSEKKIFSTNKGGSKIIESKLNNLFKPHHVLHSSTRDVYEALTYDFELIQSHGFKK